MATEAEIEQKIKKILADDFECDPERLVPDVDLFADLDLDSIDAIDLMVRLQQEEERRRKAEAQKQQEGHNHNNNSSGFGMGSIGGMMGGSGGGSSSGSSLQSISGAGRR